MWDLIVSVPDLVYLFTLNIKQFLFYGIIVRITVTYLTLFKKLILNNCVVIHVRDKNISLAAKLMRTLMLSNFLYACGSLTLR